MREPPETVSTTPLGWQVSLPARLVERRGNKLVFEVIARRHRRGAARPAYQARGVANEVA